MQSTSSVARPSESSPHPADASFNIWAWNAAAKEERKPARTGSAPHLVSGIKPLTTATPTDSRQGTVVEPIGASTSAVPQNGDPRHIASQPDLTAEPDSLPPSQPSSSSVTPAQTVLDLQRLRLRDATAVSDGESDESSDEDGSSAPDKHSATQIRVRGQAPKWGPRSIVAQRVSTHGLVSPMEPDSEVPALRPELRDQVGRVRGNGPLEKWLLKRQEWDDKYKKELDEFRSIRSKDRAAAEKSGFLTNVLGDENIPLSALAGLNDREMARKVGRSVDEPTHKTSVPLLLWMSAAEKADKEAVEGQENKEKEKEKQRRRSSAGRASGEGRLSAEIKATLKRVGS